MSSAENPNRLLVVDDETDIGEFIAEVGTALGYDVRCRASGDGFVAAVESLKPSLLILDLNLPGHDGVELLRQLADLAAAPQILLMSGMDRKVMSYTHELGAHHGLRMLGILPKPVMLEDLEARLRSALIPVTQIDAQALERGLANDELTPYFQPKASLTGTGTWQITGVEALVRWQHPDLGLVMPDDFIPLAEQSGLIDQVTEAVMTESLRQVKLWRSRRLKLSCAVNLSPGLVTDIQLPDRIAEKLEHYGLESSALSLELTESATLVNPTRTMDVLTRLRVKGVGLSLDDFGTGFSSLTQLYQMPFDELKIDKSVVADIPHSREANTMVGSLIDLAHNLGLTVCAEGVETRAALDLLAALGCDDCQGYYISRPIPARDIESFVNHFNRNETTERRMQPAS